jgi:adenylate cyclase
MIGTRNRAAFDAFQLGMTKYNYNSKAGAEQTLARFELAARIDPNYARARAAIAFALVQMRLYGYVGDDVMSRALDEAVAAVQIDPFDWFTHAQLGAVHLRRSEFAQAVAAYETALSLNEDDRTLMVDAAEAFVSAGETDRGITLIQRARRVPDWHRWQLAWAYYIKGRTDPKYYQMAIDEADRVYFKPEDDRYCRGLDRIRAAAYAQLGKADEARAALERFLKSQPGWNAARERAYNNFLNPEDREHLAGALVKAGLAAK